MRLILLVVLLTVFLGSCSSPARLEGRPQYGSGPVEVLFLDISESSYNYLEESYGSDTNRVVKLIVDPSQEDYAQAVYCAGPSGQSWNMMEIILANSQDIDLDTFARVLQVPDLQETAQTHEAWAFTCRIRSC